MKCYKTHFPLSYIILKYEVYRLLNINTALSEPSIFRYVRDKSIDAKINNLFTLKGNHGVCLKFVFGFQVIYFSQANYY